MYEFGWAYFAVSVGSHVVPRAHTPARRCGLQPHVCLCGLRIACCWRYLRAMRRIGGAGSGTLIVVCWFGSFAGDVIRFWIGRRYGARLALIVFRGSSAPVQTAVRLTDRHYVWIILFHRFPYGNLVAGGIRPTGYRGCPGPLSSRSTSLQRVFGLAPLSRWATPSVNSRRSPSTMPLRAWVS